MLFCVCEFWKWLINKQESDVFLREAFKKKKMWQMGGLERVTNKNYSLKIIFKQF